MKAKIQPGCTVRRKTEATRFEGLDVQYEVLTVRDNRALVRRRVDDKWINCQIPLDRLERVNA